MRIISKFQDYYDGAQGFGHDEHVIYVRHTEDHAVTDKKQLNWLDRLPCDRQPLFIATPFIIGFCGVLYPCLRIVYTGIPGCGKTSYAYSVQDIEKFLQALNDKNKALKAFRVPTKKHTSWYSDEVYFRRSAIEAMNPFEPFELIDPFRELNVPVFALGFTADGSLNTRALSGFVLRTDPELKKLNFQHVMPPFQAFQEIDMFLSGVLGTGNPPMAIVDDKSMKAKKGFGDYSFKTLPSKRR